MANTQLTAEFVKSINGTDKIIHEGKPQIVFLGRSNVGKSSLINSLLSRNIARSSSKPGKTVTIDFFLVNNKYYFVDLPGYGFAHRSKEQLEHFRKMIAWYLFTSAIAHKIVILIVDAVAGITDYDRESIGLFHEHHTNFVIVANKIDKLKMGDRVRRLRAITEEAGATPVIPHSIVSGEGKRELLKAIFPEGIK